MCHLLKTLSCSQGLLRASHKGSGASILVFKSLATGGESSKQQGLVGIGSLEKCITAVPGNWLVLEKARGCKREVVGRGSSV